MQLRNARTIVRICDALKHKRTPVVLDEELENLLSEANCDINADLMEWIRQDRSDNGPGR